MKVIAKIAHLEWDNHQGSRGTVIVKDKLIDVPYDTKIEDVKAICIEKLHTAGQIDDWSRRVFTGKGLISITIL